MIGVPYIKAGAYAPLHGFAQSANPPSNAGWLRSSTVGFAEPFRSVCRNLSGKLPSHPFAALTGLAAASRGCWSALFSLKVLQQPLLSGVSSGWDFFATASCRSTRGHFPNLHLPASLPLSYSSEGCCRRNLSSERKCLWWAEHRKLHRY